MNATAMRLVRAVNRNWTKAIQLVRPGWDGLHLASHQAAGFPAIEEIFAP